MQQQQQILSTCQKINSFLQLQYQSFPIQSLYGSQWYIQVISIIFNHLQQKLQQLINMQDEAKAIDQLLIILSEEGFIEQDFLEIKGEDIINGHNDSVYYVVELINALLERQIEEQQRQQEGNKDGQGEQQEGEQYGNDFQQTQQQQTQVKNSIKRVSQPTPHNQNQHIKKSISSSQPQKKQNNKQNQTQQQQQQHSQQQQQYSQSKQQHHSVLGIAHQFEQSDQQEQQQQEQITKKHQQQVNNNKKTHNINSNSLNNMNHNKNIQNINNNNQKQLIETNYKTIQQMNAMKSKQNTKEKQSDSNIMENNQYNPFSNINSNNKNNKKPFFPTSEGEQDEQTQKLNNNKKGGQNVQNNNHKFNQQSGSEDQNQYFNTNLQPKGLKKYKSDQKIKQLNSGSKKSTTKKVAKVFNNNSANIQSTTSPKITKKKPRQLITHPTIKKQFRKATNPQAKQLTFQVKQNLNKLIKRKKQQKSSQKLPQKSTNVTQQQLDRKRKQVKIKVTQYKKNTHIAKQRKLKTHTLQQHKSQNQLNKILNWRQGQLKKQKKQFQQAMQLKLQVQKENYIKKINNLILKLQKQKQLQQQKDYKQKIYKENKQAASRLTAIEQWYKDRINLLKESRKNNKEERNLLHTGHKEILKTIEKQLKRENQKQIMTMTMKFKKNQAMMENDLEELEREIRQVYKRN